MDFKELSLFNINAGVPGNFIHTYLDTDGFDSLQHRYAVEIPTKFLTYACVGWNAVYTVPLAIHTAEMFLFDGGGFEAYVGNPMELFRGS